MYSQKAVASLSKLDYSPNCYKSTVALHP